MPWSPPPATLNTAYYARIATVADVVIVDFTSGLSEAPLIARTPVLRANIADSGMGEYLLVREEVTVRLIWEFLSKAEADSVKTFFDNYGKTRTQVKVTLARTIVGVSTPAGQWEYDNYNAYFTKAELLDPSFVIPRRIRMRDIYSAVLTFRQGQ